MGIKTNQRSNRSCPGIQITYRRALRWLGGFLLIVLSVGTPDFAWAKGIPGNFIETQENRLATGKVLDYLTAFESLAKLSDEEIADMEKQIEAGSTFPRVATVIARIQKERESVSSFVLHEDILLGGAPRIAGAVRDTTSGKKPTLADISAEAERIYPDGLQLTHAPQPLRQKSPGFFVREADAQAPSVPPENGQSVKQAGTRRLLMTTKELRTVWTYGRGEDTAHNYFYDVRQWVKSYEEPLLCPIMYRGVLFLQNDDRIFCLQQNTGEEVWSYAPDTNGEEYYQTYRAPHQNSVGQKLSVRDSRMCAVVGGKLVALDVADTAQPRLMWARSLGEYTACTIPYQTDKTVVMGLTNARGELWIAGFDALRGVLSWSTYIGIASFLPPASSLVCAADGAICIGTNQGVVVCLEGESGSIRWLRRYTPKQYDMITYWQQQRYYDTFRQAGSIPYDSQFLAGGEDGYIYYKPRESNYAYVFNARTGDEFRHLYNDGDRYAVIYAGKGIAAFWEKTSLFKSIAKSRIVLVNLRSGTEEGEFLVEPGPWRGSVVSADDGVAFKIDDAVYRVSWQEQDFHVETIVAKEYDWLLAASRDALFLGDNRHLVCVSSPDALSASSETAAKPPEIATLQQLSARRAKLQENFALLITNGTASMPENIIQSEVIAELRQVRPLLSEMFPCIIRGQRYFDSPQAAPLGAALLEMYGREVVSYRGVELRFDLFWGKFRGGTAPARVPDNRANAGVGPIGDTLVARAEKLIVVPVKKMADAPEIDFSLVALNDQLIGVDESGNVLWQRRIFFNPQVGMGVSLATDRKWGRVHAETLEAFLVGTTLIINDGVNVIGVDPWSGTYRWSMTTRGAALDRLDMLPLPDQDTLYQTYGVSRKFVAQAMKRVLFFENQLYVVCGEKISAIDPATGYVERDSILPFQGALACTSNAQGLILLSSQGNEWASINKELTHIQRFPLKKPLTDEELPVMFATNEQLILCSETEICVIDLADGNVETHINMLPVVRRYFELIDDALILIEPFTKVVCYDLRKGLRVKWENNGIAAENAILHYPPNEPAPPQSRYYHCTGEGILMPYVQDGVYYLGMLDVASGHMKWVTRAEGVRGPFYYMSNVCSDTGRLYFTLSTISIGDEHRRLLPLDTVSHAKTYWYGIEEKTGRLSEYEKLPPRSGFRRGFNRITFAQTMHTFWVGLYGDIMQIRRKSRD